MKWSKRGKCTSLHSFVEENSGIDLSDLSNTKNYLIPRMKDGRDFILWAIKNDLHITVVGDYDGDGLTSISVLTILLTTLGAKYSIIVPKRMSEGYGISDKIIKRIKKGLVITVDNGIKALEPIRKLRENGYFVFVLDHHEASETGELPNANLIIDPKAVPDGADFTDYCGAGLSYKLAEAILGKEHPIMPTLLSLAAIGTITDSVELIKDNRKIVAEGLKNLCDGSKRTLGTGSLLELTKANIDNLEADDIGFYLGPCINAPGRMEDAGGELVVKCLLASDKDKADALASLITEINNRRKSITADIMAGIDLDELRNSKRKTSFVYRDSIPEGIIGIVAGSIAEYTGKPTFVMSNAEHGFIKGSSRAKYEQNSIADILNGSADILTKFGGHKKAGGFSLKFEDVMIFEKRVEMLAKAEIWDPNILYYDLAIDANQVNKIHADLKPLKPFGEGNPMPTFMINETGIKEVKLLKEQHLKVTLANGVQCIGFNMKEAWENKANKERITIVGEIKSNFYNGKEYVQVMIKDFK